MQLDLESIPDGSFTGVLFGVISKGTLLKKLLMVKCNTLQETPPGIATWQLR